MRIIIMVVVVGTMMIAEMGRKTTIYATRRDVVSVSRVVGAGVDLGVGAGRSLDEFVGEVEAVTGNVGVQQTIPRDLQYNRVK